MSHQCDYSLLDISLLLFFPRFSEPTCPDTVAEAIGSGITVTDTLVNVYFRNTIDQSLVVHYSDGMSITESTILSRTTGYVSKH